MAGYNLTRTVDELLVKTDTLPPSFTIHLHVEYWTLNNGPKFLYNSQVASLLDDIRAQRIPVDFLELFDSAKVPFYDGCMIVELLDYRAQHKSENAPTPERPERTRVVLRPTSESLWADICLLRHKFGDKWTDHDALEIESRILLATTPPLCLDPDPHLTRIANHVLRVSTPNIPTALKRNAAAMDPEDFEFEKARRAKIMQFMNPRPNRLGAPNYRILDTIRKLRPESTPPAPVPSQDVALAINPSQPQSQLEEQLPQTQTPVAQPQPSQPQPQPLSPQQPPQPQPQPQPQPPKPSKPVPTTQPSSSQPSPIPSITHTTPPVALDGSAKRKARPRKKGDTPQSSHTTPDRRNSTPKPGLQHPQTTHLHSHPNPQQQQQQHAHPHPQANRYHFSQQRSPYLTPSLVSQAPMRTIYSADVRRVASPAQQTRTFGQPQPGSQHPTYMRPPQTMSTFQPANTQQLHYIQQATQALRNGQMKDIPNGGHPSQVRTPSGAPGALQRYTFLQHQQRLQSGQPQAGPSVTPQQRSLISRSPMLVHQISAQHQQPQQGSPLAMTSRSPGPSSTPLGANAVTSTASHQQQQTHAYMAAYMASPQQHSPEQTHGGGGSNNSESPRLHLGTAGVSGTGGAQNVGVGVTQSTIPGQVHQEVSSSTHALPMNMHMNMLAYPHHPYGEMAGMMNMPMNYWSPSRMPLYRQAYAWPPDTTSVGVGRGRSARMGEVGGQVPGMPPGTQQQEQGQQQGQHSQHMGKGMPGR